jgi:hypothetical protein
MTKAFNVFMSWDCLCQPTQFKLYSSRQVGLWNYSNPGTILQRVLQT